MYSITTYSWMAGLWELQIQSRIVAGPRQAAEA